MKSALMSMKPYWAFLMIAKKKGWKVSRPKTLEIRKTYPKAHDWDGSFDVYITKDEKSLQRVPEKYREEMRTMMEKVAFRFECTYINQYTAEFTDDPNCYEEIRLVWKDSDGDEDYYSIIDNEAEHYEECLLFGKSCLTWNELKEYVGVNCHDTPFYGMEVEDILLHVEPKPLTDFYMETKDPYDERITFYEGRGQEVHFFKPIIRPPQSWCYVWRAEV